MRLSSPRLFQLLTSTGLVLALVDNECGHSVSRAWTSSGDGKYQLSEYDAPILGQKNSEKLETWNLDIREKTGRRQTIKGFGAAVTDGTVEVYRSLPAHLQRQMVKDIMTNDGDGLNFNLMRHTIGASDLTSDPAYTFDDNHGQPDPNMNGFHLGQRGNQMADMLAQMRALQPELKILGSPWSPPGWMQHDGVIAGAEDGNNLIKKYAEAFAEYFVKYLKAFDRRGAHIDAITLQNEPLANKAGMPSFYIGPHQSAELVRDHVGPALHNAHLNTEIWAYDHNPNRYDYPETVVKKAGQYVSAAAWHCYEGVGAQFPQQWTNLSRFHDNYPHYDQYMTECYTAANHTDWIYVSSFFMLPLQHWANGIIAWGLGTWPEGGPAFSGNQSCDICTGLVEVEKDGSSYSKAIFYYMIGQFSKFIPKGSQIVNVRGTQVSEDGKSGLEAIASVNPDGSRTIVVQNRQHEDVFVRVHTQSEKRSWNARVYKKSVTTWVLPAI